MSASVTRKHTLSAVVLGLALAFGASAQTGTAGTTGATGSTGSSASAGGSKAATGAASASKTSHGPDHSFVEKAAIGGMAEVELGNLAQQKASSDEVKQFASRMVQDHGKANDELKQIASSKGIDLPTALDKKHRSEVDRLGKMSGAQFDRAYMSHMVDDHKKDVADFKKASTSAKDSDVKGFASKTLPTLQEHLQLAQKTNDDVKKADRKSAGSKPAAAKTAQ